MCVCSTRSYVRVYVDTYFRVCTAVLLIGLNKLSLFGTKIVTLFGQREKCFLLRKHSGVWGLLQGDQIILKVATVISPMSPFFRRLFFHPSSKRETDHLKRSVVMSDSSCMSSWEMNIFYYVSFLSSLVGFFSMGG